MLKDSRKTIYTRIIVVSSLAIACFMFLHNILNGFSAFWFDPARDFILALNNLQKISLIGSPTGIPGVFYGPYWIWILSLGMIVTRNPALIIILLQVIPYFIIFPLIFFKFQKIFSKGICLTLLWLFYLTAGNYIIQIWNVNYAPLIFLTITYLVVRQSKSMNLRVKLVSLFVIAILNALLINFHFSFGFAISLASTLFIGISELLRLILLKQNLRAKTFKFLTESLVYLLGFVLVELPFIIFEIRHNFIQTRAIINTVTQAFFYNTAVVGQTGLGKAEILKQILLNKPAQILNVNTLGIILIYILVAASITHLLVKRQKSSIDIPVTLTTYLLASTVAITLVYSSSKNPIFFYHFSGYEIIVLLTVAIIVKNIKFLKSLLYMWVFLQVSLNIFSFIKNYNYVQYKGTPLWLKQAIVKTIYDDAKNNPFQTYAYSPAIYTYDYDYLFDWLGADYYKNKPVQNGSSSQITYLIIPETSKGIYYDFINYKTPNSLYHSQKIWVMVDGTTILKRQPKTN